MVRLEKVTPENWRLGLKVSELQKRYVSDSANILARAWAYRDENSEAFVIYDDKESIGMAMYYDIDEMGRMILVSFLLMKNIREKGMVLRLQNLYLNI